MWQVWSGNNLIASFANRDAAESLAATIPNGKVVKV